MALTVNDLINQYRKIEESNDYNVNFNLSTNTDSLTEEEAKVFYALNMGVVTEKVLDARRLARRR